MVIESRAKSHDGITLQGDLLTDLGAATSALFEPAP